MAKVKGPLMSMEASGTYGGTLTFGKWKGRAYVRQHVTPRNPNSAGQALGRNRMRVTANAQKFVNGTQSKESGQTMTDKERLIRVTPSDKVWNAYLVTNMVGQGGLNYKQAQDAYATLSVAEQAAWNSAAKTLSPEIGDTFQKAETGGTDSVVSAGETFFMYRYALARLNLAQVPNGTPPHYA
ncbi:conserved hypothetical protein [Gammaproteobacteria bacterium]